MRRWPGLTAGMAMGMGIALFGLSVALHTAVVEAQPWPAITQPESSGRGNPGDAKLAALSAADTATPTGTPVPAVFVDSALTGRIDWTPTDVFTAGAQIRYMQYVSNTTGISRTAQLDISVSGPCGMLLANSSPILTGPGLQLWGLASTIPADACNGSYAFTSMLTYGGAISTHNAFFVVEGGVAQTATPTPTPSITPVVSPTPSRTPTGTPVPSIVVQSALTGDAALTPRSVFTAGEPIRYMQYVVNTTGVSLTVQLDSLASGPCGVIVSNSAPILSQPGTWLWSLLASVPAGACNGSYTYTATVHFSDTTTQASAPFSVVGGIAPTATATGTPTATATGTPTATWTPTPTPATPSAIPPNDDFDAATDVIASPFSTLLDTSGATSDPDDPPFTGCKRGAAAATVWYRFAPPSPGVMLADTHGSNYDTLLGVWTGTRKSLVPVQCSDDTGPDLTSQVHVQTIPGRVYYLEAAHLNTVAAGAAQTKAARPAAASAGGNLSFHLVFLQSRAYLPLLSQ